MYHYAGNNPVCYIDPDGRELDATFEVTSYEKTKDGWTAYGTLTVTDRDTNETVSANAYSGGRGRDSDGVSLPIPIGEYEILSPTEIGYRLEAVDSNKGNDIIDGTNPEQGNIRLHKPGAGLSYGCIGVATDGEWKNVEKIISETSIAISKVDRFRGLSSIQITKYGNLTVTQNKSIVYRDLYASKQYRQEYVHQRMK